MIHVLANKLPTLPDKKSLIWKNSDDALYNKFSQYDKPKLPMMNAVPTVVPVVKRDLSNEISEISEISEVSKINVQRIPRVLKVSPIKITNNYPNIAAVADTETKKIKKVLNPIIKVSKKPNPIDIILSESSMCDIYKSDVKEKIIVFITSNEFSKVFGITKSSELMSGIVNERVNKSVALFISFLFDKRVIYNEKEFIFNKNKEMSGTINV